MNNKSVFLELSDFDKNILNFISYLIILLPILVVTGPFLPDLVISLSALLFIYINFKYRSWRAYINKLSIVYFSWCLYLIIRSIFSADPFLSLESSLFYWRFGLFTLLTVFLLNFNIFIKDYFLYSLLFVFIILIIDGYYQYINGINLLGYEYDNRLGSLFGDELVLGNFLSRLFPLLFALIIFKKFQKNFLIYLTLILFILTDVLVYVAGERLAIANLLIGSIFIILLINKYKYLRLLSLIVSILIMVIISLNNDVVKSRVIDKTINDLNIKNGNPSYIISSNYEDMFKTAGQIFKDNPIYGVGPKIYRIECEKEQYKIYKQGCSTHPHNIYLQLLSEAGIVGILPIIILFLFLIYTSFKHAVNLYIRKSSSLSDEQVCLIASLIVTLWPFAPSFNFFGNWISVIYYLPLPFLLHSMNIYKTESITHEK